MIKTLIENCIDKVGSKRQLGIELGYKKEYAGQSVNKLLKHENPKWDSIKKLLSISGIDNDVMKLIKEHSK